MSANLLHDKTVLGESKNIFHFSQHVPMSTYLVAIASGALENREIGPRSRVWCEKEMVDAAAYEFAETEDFIKAGEELLGEYVWGQYDLLVTGSNTRFRIIEFSLDSLDCMREIWPKHGHLYILGIRKKCQK